MDNSALLEVSAGTVIVRENAVSDRVFIIDEGEVEILRRVEGKFREMRRLGPGDFFGQLSLLEDLPSSDVARAVSDCRLLTISQDLLPHVLRENIDVALLMIRRLSIRAEETQQLTLDAAPPPPTATTAPEPEEPPEETPEDPLATAVLPVTIPFERTEPSDSQDSEATNLLHEESGTVLTLPQTEIVTVGRLHIDFSPDIDLRLLDTQRSVSRLHARITLRDHLLLLKEDPERPSVNGTFVNEERLVPGQEHTLADGDRLRFGTLSLLFRREKPQADS